MLYVLGYLTLVPVSYTHLDVYKRQFLYSAVKKNKIGGQQQKRANCTVPKKE